MIVTVFSTPSGARAWSYRKCQDCGKEQPAFGASRDQSRRWCSYCRAKHPEVASEVASFFAPSGGKLCESCAKAPAGFGLLAQGPTADGLSRWCRHCAAEQAEAVPVGLLTGAVDRTILRGPSGHARADWPGWPCEDCRSAQRLPSPSHPDRAPMRTPPPSRRRPSTHARGALAET